MINSMMVVVVAAYGLHTEASHDVQKALMVMLCVFVCILAD